MHASQRDQLILELLGESGFVAFQALNDRIQASPATLRRDLDRLEEAGRLIRVHGGARLPTAEDGAPASAAEVPKLGGIPFHQNIQRHLAAKQAIGAAAAALCRPHESIIIDGGSTTLQMCRHLEALELQVLSNSLHIIDALLPQRGTRIAVPAGAIFREQNIVLSPFDDDGMGRYHASRMFMGAASVGRHGVMQTDVMLAEVERRLIERADELVLMADSSKFTAPAGHRVCALNAVDTVITDDGIDGAARELLENAGVNVIVVTT